MPASTVCVVITRRGPLSAERTWDTLKIWELDADLFDMTALEFTLTDWEVTPLGKVARGAIAVLGVITATLTLMLSALMDGGAWMTLLAGVALAATSARAANEPSLARLTAVTANLILIPLLMRLG